MFQIQGSTIFYAPSQIRNCCVAPTPRNNPPDKPSISTKTVLFDLILYLSGQRMNIVARYFNKDGRIFDNNSDSMFMICCVFAKSDTTYDVKSPSLHAEDIHAFTDILWLFPFSPVDKLRVNPWVTVSGLVRSVTPDTGPFRIIPSQYIGILRSLQPTTIVAHFDIDNNPKFKNSRPIPSADTYVQVSGYLSYIDNSRTFYLDVDEISFLGRPEVPTNQSPAKKKQKINDAANKNSKKRDQDEWDDSGTDTDSTLDNADIFARDIIKPLTSESLPTSNLLADATSTPFASTSTHDPAATMSRVPSTTNN